MRPTPSRTRTSCSAPPADIPFTPVRLVADESCDFSVVVGLRRVGHDIVAIAETMSGADDDEVIALANSDERLLITEDKDFGRLVYAAARAHSGVILIRYPAAARSSLTDDVVKLLAERGTALYGCFAVLEPGRARVTTTVT
jgi:predicted nuclease of predicted toxin-antitoxin system